jgi:hypothetical protein
VGDERAHAELAAKGQPAPVRLDRLVGLAPERLDVAEKADCVGFSPALGRRARHVERLQDRAERIVEASGAQVRDPGAQARPNVS